MTDMVNHPAHYNMGKYEVIDLMRKIFGDEATKHFCILSSYKYRKRAGFKENADEDIQKAEWYENYVMENL